MKHHEETDETTEQESTEQESTDDETGTPETGIPETGNPEPGSLENYGEGDDGQDYVDRSKIDFDPADGLLSGTAIDGTSDIPDPDSVTTGEGDTTDD